MQRSLARQTAMQLLYERLSGGTCDEDSIRMIMEQFGKTDYFELPADDQEYINGMLGGIAQQETMLREKIAGQLSSGWTLDRLNRVDLCVLLLGAYEILCTDVPDNVAVSEAVNLADLYTEPKNKRFINGVLGEIARRKTAGAEEAEQ